MTQHMDEWLTNRRRLHAACCTHVACGGASILHTDNLEEWQRRLHIEEAAPTMHTANASSQMNAS